MMTKDKLRQLTGDERLGQMRESEYLYQELYEQYRNVSEQRAGKWSHPIARLLVKVFQTLSWPFKYWGRGVK